MTTVAKTIPQVQFRCCNSTFMKHLRGKRLLATNMYTHSGKKVRSYYNHLLVEKCKRQGLKRLLNKIL